MNEARRAELESLLMTVIDGALDDEQRIRLRELLSDDPAAQRFYRDYLNLHVMLEWQHGSMGAAVSGGEPFRPARSSQGVGLSESLDHLVGEPLSAETRAKALKELHELAEAQRRKPTRIQMWLRGIDADGDGARRLRLNMPVAAFSAAALIMIGVALVIILLSGGQSIDAPTPGAPTWPDGMLARVDQLLDAEWNDDATGLHKGQWLPAQSAIGLKKGFVQLGFRDGARLILEGPCELEVKEEALAFLSHGRLAARVPGAATGFTIDTPAATVIDLGTEFGVSVSGDRGASTTHVEVFEGKVEIQTRPTLSTPSENVRLVNGDAKQIAMNGEEVSLTSLPDGMDLVVRNMPLPGDVVDGKIRKNIAFEKPVTGSGFYAVADVRHCTFDRITDGRSSDVGFPENPSYWLGREKQKGEYVTVDLQKVYLVDRIDLQNTRNGIHHDRGTADFRILISTDNVKFTEIKSGTLMRIEGERAPGIDYPFEAFDIGPVRARYVRVIADTFYSNETHGGAGLNEIRVFSVANNESGN